MVTSGKHKGALKDSYVQFGLFGADGVVLSIVSELQRKLEEQLNHYKNESNSKELD